VFKPAGLSIANPGSISFKHSFAPDLIAARARITWARALFDQFIPRTAPTAPEPALQPARQQVVDVAQRRVGRAFGQRRPFGVGELALGAVEQAIERRELRVSGCARMR
jgi:hypothetical protein